MGNGVTEIFSGILSYLTLDPIDIDNWNFKLHKLSFVLFFAASTTSILTSHFGDAIECASSSNQDFVESFCWLHGSYHIENAELEAKINRGENCLRPSPDQILTNGEPGRCTNDDGHDEKCDATNRPHAKYYVWVSWMLLLNGVLFILPNLLWKVLEGGKIKAFELEKDELDPEEESKKIMKAARKFNTSSPKAKNSYFYKFIAMECLNLAVAISNFFIIHKFLSGQFLVYGIEAVNYLAGNAEKTQIQGSDKTFDEILNPMCGVFPTMVNCLVKIPSVVGGATDSQSILCILSQNLVNQFIYIILWWWFIVLFLSNGVMVIYRIITIFNVFNARHTKLLFLMKTWNNDHPTMKATDDFRNNLQIGEWFLLSQIGRNSNPHFFRKFLQEVVNPTIDGKNEFPAKNRNNEKQLRNNVDTGAQRPEEDTGLLASDRNTTDVENNEISSENQNNPNQLQNNVGTGKQRVVEMTELNEITANQ